mgnify:CR=1 FL=1
MPQSLQEMAVFFVAFREARYIVADRVFYVMRAVLIDGQHEGHDRYVRASDLLQHARRGYQRTPSFRRKLARARARC